MDLSIPIQGLQTADAAFDSAAASITKAFQGSTSGASGEGDTASLSEAVAGLLASKLNFIANEKVAVVEDSINKSTFSIVG